MQADFIKQKREIKEIIRIYSIYDKSYNIVFLYFKFYYKINYIKKFWYYL